MSDRSDPDAELAAELRSLLNRIDAVPPEVTKFAKAALGWRRLDADLAELLADSALETDAAALTRSEGGAGRWLTFRAADLAIDIMVETDGDASTLLGQLAPPPASAGVELQAADGTVIATVDADTLGRFRMMLDARGRVRLRVLRRDPPGVPVETSWLSI